MYIYIYIYTHVGVCVYICLYIYIYTYRERERLCVFATELQDSPGLSTGTFCPHVAQGAFRFAPLGISVSQGRAVI